MWTSALLLGLTIGCSEPTSDPWQACEDARCRRDWLLEHWDDASDLALQRVGQLPDPLEQVALVKALVNAGKPITADLCQAIPQGGERDHCYQYQHRPHLWEVDGASEAPAPRQGTSVATGQGDPAAAGDGSKEAAAPGRRFRLEESPLDAWAGVEPAEVPCDDPLEPHSCASSLARQRAEAGDGQGAGVACLSIEDLRWRNECFFQAAEVRLSPRQTTSLPDTFRLCLGSGAYLNRCMVHAAGALGQSSPMASASVSRWSGLIGAVQVSREELESWGGDYARRFEEQVWAESLASAYATVRPVRGDPLEVVPVSALPHVRAAAAARLLELQGAGEDSLDSWSQRLEQALADRTSFAHDTRPDKGSPHYHNKVTDLWVKDLDKEGEVPWVAYMGMARRTFVEDPVVDGRICLLEAAARLEPPAVALLAEGLEHEHWAVRWTATRLLAEAGPTGISRLSSMRSDPDPRVQGRALVRRPSGPGARGGGGSRAEAKRPEKGPGGPGQGKKPPEGKKKKAPGPPRKASGVE
ncbi:MAG: hypothetical protein QGG40_03590 [Myxococcota bacterium]|jgi:hypothetical protein|nr:hypothetical protein [Myxococcota bacterium]